MKVHVEGYQYDVIDENGHYLVLTKDEAPIHSDELAQVELNMLRANQIPYVAHMHVEEMDFTVRFLYDITSKQPLHTYLKEQTITMKDMFQFLLLIVKTLEASKEYMLKEHNYILDEQFIFIGKELFDIHLIYVPMKKRPETLPLHEKLKTLATTLVGRVQEMHGSGYQQILQQLSEPAFSMKELKETLHALVEQPLKRDSTSENQINLEEVQQAEEPAVKEEPEPPKTVKKMSKVKRPPQSPPPIAKTPRPQAGQHKTSQAKQASKGNVKKAAAEPLPKLTQREKTVMGVIAFFVSALAFKMYLDNPSEGQLYISLGIIMIVLSGMGIYAKVWRLGRPISDLLSPGQKEASEQPPQPMSKTARPQPRKKQTHAAPAPTPQTHRPAQSESRDTTAKEESDEQEDSFQAVGARKEAQHYEALNQHTTLLQKKPDQTTLLGDDNRDAIQTKAPPAYLTKEKDGQKDNILIEAANVVVGRSEDSADIVEQTEGVSRAHFEIIRVDNEYGVKDLGSLNGTFLNGEKWCLTKCMVSTLKMSSALPRSSIFLNRMQVNENQSVGRRCDVRRRTQ
ncbi:FHA domain-containing protein [Bacillaceae bacterium SIJ1]|uniref:DUF6382 domain-containing protein n=1 Tax=Litoribacterium kuwaitense TaxID=1398745 RepID=UPI0013EC8606|nr:DUF6382 domain-containing protein [Litoribacterium kuwaitense]NGP44447.1 FHA domain-containing protein [Litoribacterium kuwaitense]